MGVYCFKGGRNYTIQGNPNAIDRKSTDFWHKLNATRQTKCKSITYLAFNLPIVAFTLSGDHVSKAKLDVYVPAKQEGLRATTFEVANDIAGFRKLRDVTRSANATVCVEPTGGYELELIAFMHKFNVPVAYVDALRVRQFARAEGNLSKNDRIDAALIARFAAKIGARALSTGRILQPWS